MTIRAKISQVGIFLRRGVPILLLCWTLGNARPAGAAEGPFAETKAIYAYLNEMRGKAGLPPLQREPHLEQAAQAHADYLAKLARAGKRPRGLAMHEETPGLPGFTGALPSDRAGRAGYPHGAVETIAPTYTEDKTAIAKGAVTGLLNTIYHRFPNISFTLMDVGIGIAEWRKDRYGVVFNYGGNRDSGPLPPVVVWPPDGAEGIDPVFIGEIPDPVPDLKYPGYPITLQVNPAHDPPELVYFKLFKITRAGGEENHSEVTRTRLLTAQTDVKKQMNRREFGLFPLDPPAQLHWYSAQARLRNKTGERTLTWKFRIGAYPPWLLFGATHDNEPEMLRKLLKGGADPNFRGKGWTLLNVSVGAKKPWPELVKVLLEGGADPNLADENGRAALEIAAANNRPELAALLLKAGANPNLPEKEQGYTPLMIAVRAKEPRPELVKVLLEGGADPNLRDNHGRTALVHTIWENRPGLTAQLLKGGANPDLPEKEQGYTPLMNAVRAKEPRPELVKVLLEGGADPNLEDNQGRTALVHTLWENRPELAALLLKAGANPDLPGKRQGYTPLMITVLAKEPQPELVKVLLEGGANPNLQDNHGRTALKMAKSRKLTEIVTLLETAGR